MYFLKLTSPAAFSTFFNAAVRKLNTAHEVCRWGPRDSSVFLGPAPASARLLHQAGGWHRPCALHRHSLPPVGRSLAPWMERFEITGSHIPEQLSAGCDSKWQLTPIPWPAAPRQAGGAAWGAFQG